MSGEGILRPVEICEECLERLQGLQSQLDSSAALAEGGGGEGEGEGGWEGEREEEREKGGGGEERKSRKSRKWFLRDNTHCPPILPPPTSLPPPFSRDRHPLLKGEAPG